MRIVKTALGFLLPAAVGVYLILKLGLSAETDMNGEYLACLASAAALLICGVTAGMQYPRKALRSGVMAGIACGVCLCGGVLFLLPEKTFLLFALLLIPVAAVICAAGAAVGAVLHRVRELRLRDMAKEAADD